MAVWKNPSRSEIFEILKPAFLAPTTTSHSFKSPFFSILMHSLNFSMSVDCQPVSIKSFRRNSCSNKLINCKVFTILSFQFSLLLGLHRGFDRDKESERQEWLCYVAVIPRPQGPTVQPTQRIWRLLLNTSRGPMKLLHSWLQECPWAGNGATLYKLACTYC